MPTVKGSFSFVPQIAERHVSGFFRKRLIMGQLATVPPVNEFPTQRGGVITFPYYNTIAAAEEGREGIKPTRDTLGDSSFTAEIKEIVKSISITSTAEQYMGMSRAQWDVEATKQMGRVFAEKVEADIWTELGKATSHMDLTSPSKDATYSSAFAGDDKGQSALTDQKCNIRAIASGLTEAFGDRRNEAKAVILHSEMYKDIETDEKSGFLKADANDPFYKIKGFVGRSSFLFGLAFFVNDGVPAGANVTVTDSASATQAYKTYNMVIIKNNAYGFIPKQYPEISYDSDIEARVDFMVGTQWYAIKSFHRAVSTSDNRIAFKRFTTTQQA